MLVNDSGSKLSVNVANGKELLRKIFQNKLALAIIFFMLGAFTIGEIDKHREATNVQAPALPPPPPGLSIAQDSGKFFDDLFNQDFFKNSHNPFAEMQRVEQLLLQRYSPAELLQNDFNQWYVNKFGGGDVNDVKQREDDKNIYYDITLKGDIPKNLRIGIRDNQIQLSPEAESNDLSSKFKRIFPIPANVDTEKYKIEKGANQIVISFPKKGQTLREETHGSEVYQ